MTDSAVNVDPAGCFNGDVGIGGRGGVNLKGVGAQGEFCVFCVHFAILKFRGCKTKTSK